MSAAERVWPCGCVKGEAAHGVGWADCANLPRRMNEVLVELDTLRGAKALLGIRLDVAEGMLDDLDRLKDYEEAVEEAVVEARAQAMEP